MSLLIPEHEHGQINTPEFYQDVHRIMRQPDELESCRKEQGDWMESVESTGRLKWSGYGQLGKRVLAKTDSRCLGLGRGSSYCASNCYVTPTNIQSDPASFYLVI